MDGITSVQSLFLLCISQGAASVNLLVCMEAVSVHSVYGKYNSCPSSVDRRSYGIDKLVGGVGIDNKHRKYFIAD